MCAMLGANSEGAIKPSFHNPCDGNKIYIMYDPSHMIKLAKSKLSDFFDWSFIVKLEELSREKNIGLAHRLIIRHIKWKERAMNV